MFHIIRPDQMRRLEQQAFADGIRSFDLMERAAQAVVDALERLVRDMHSPLVGFFCGSGNNGGDGLAAARLYALRGGRSVILLHKQPSGADSRENLRLAQELSIPIIEDDAWPAIDAAVDAWYGIGLDRPLAGADSARVDRLNALNIPVLAVDIPSGINALSGSAEGSFVRATATVSFQYAKPGHYLSRYPEAIGRLDIADIGLSGTEGDFEMITALEPGDLRHCLPRRSPASHKGDHGRAFLYCGSLGMAGAAALAALGCVRAGGGLTTVVCPDEIVPTLQALVPNAQCLPLSKAQDGLPRHDVLLAGCGLGQTPGTWERLNAFYHPELPTVLDADALNLLAQAPRKLSRQTLLTPHVGEAARLLNCGTDDVLNDMLAAASAISETYDAVVLLKSHCSVITDGRRSAMNTLSAPLLAKGGSGDALAGIITGLMAQGLPPFEAAQAGSLWLSRAAQLAEKPHGPRSALTAEVLALLGQAELVAIQPRYVR